MKKKTTQQFIEKAKLIHSGKYNYSITHYISAKTNVDVICRKHGVFSVTPDNHIGKKSGCPKCKNVEAGKRNSLILKGTTHNNFAGSVQKRKENFLLKARNKHGDKYDYSLVEYKSGRALVKLVCSHHGIFEMPPKRHLIGAGCPKCAIEERRSTQSQFVNRAIKVHGDKYDYSMVDYKTGVDSVRILCPLHGEFLQTPSKHLAGQGCPRCQSSHGERLIRQWLIAHNIEFEEQKMFQDCVNSMSGRKLKFDFYIKKLNICIEFDGEQHFRPSRNGRISEEQVSKIKFRDNIKNDFCKSTGKRILRISYLDLRKVRVILEKEILNWQNVLCGLYGSVKDYPEKYDITAYVS